MVNLSRFRVEGRSMILSHSLGVFIIILFLITKLPLTVHSGTRLTYGRIAFSFSYENIAKNSLEKHIAINTKHDVNKMNNKTNMASHYKDHKYQSLLTILIENFYQPT